MTTIDCLRAGKWFGGCRFEARFDLPEFKPGNAQGTVYGVLQMIEHSRAKIYVRDVCVRCGKTIEREAIMKATP